MRDTVDTDLILSLIRCAENLESPAQGQDPLAVLEQWQGQELLDKLEAWTVDPLLILEPQQRELIEDALRRYGRR
jgi:hypothetical protein